ncbi:hypothetical protein [Stackebrandtia soli]|uniref:hypothetical protein n=1 Tax=Stackebrandtia soli TaxID=1892856 RepID=UPI0039EC03D8
MDEIGRFVGAVVHCVVAVCEIENGVVDPNPEGYELLLGEGRSVAVTTGTDWTLRVEDGTWPSLPTWAWPPESWTYVDVDVPLGTPETSVVEDVELLRDEVGETGGLRVDFELARLVIRAGEFVSLRWHRDKTAE